MRSGYLRISLVFAICAASTAGCLDEAPPVARGVSSAAAPIPSTTAPEVDATTGPTRRLAPATRL